MTYQYRITSLSVYSSWMASRSDMRASRRVRRWVLMGAFGACAAAIVHYPL